ncbi:MAG: T9SS type A sorting domain-containing protein [Flavobacteriales bacterium]|nr:T9SS type A sorting domain-containing protein [Flavobacteriales bacterium]
MIRTLHSSKFFLLFGLSLVSLSAHASISFSISPAHCTHWDAVIITQVSGGVPPYTFSWSDGPTTQNRYNVNGGTYTLTVTDLVGGVQQAEATVPTLPNYPWDPNTMFAQAIPSCLPGPEPNGGGYMFFGGDQYPAPAGVAPHEFDTGCLEQPFAEGNIPTDWSWFVNGTVRAVCFLGMEGQSYTIGYTDATGCPGTMEVTVPQVPQFYPVGILDIEGSCSGGTNGRVRFSIPAEPDYIYGVRPHLYNPDWQENEAFWNSMAMNWTGGAEYDVPDLGPGTYALVRKISIDPDWAQWFPCGDTTYITIPDLGPTCGYVNGTVALDVNEDCTLQWSDTRIPETVLEFLPGPYYATTNTTGGYAVHLPLGSYTVHQQSTVLREHCLGDPSSLTVAGNMTYDLLDTALMTNDVQLTMASGPARPGFELSYALDIDALTSAAHQLNSLVLTVDAELSYVSASPTPSNVSGNTITWSNFGWLNYFGHRDVNVRFLVPPDVNLIGNELQASATLGSNGDQNTLNNVADGSVVVTGSYDPNDKVATTSSGASREHYYIDVDEWVDYVVRFQNTGTDTAFTVVITDTLPTTLDPATLVMGAGSHPFTWELEGSGTVRLMFANILLPDSNVNEPASHGFVSFRVRPKQPLVPGLGIENVANIFFDLNPPVITEPSVLVAEFSTGTRDQAPGQGRLRLLPNPARDQLLVNAEGTMTAVRIIAADGREVLRTRVRSTHASIVLEQLKAGVYFISASFMDGSEIRERFIKE